MAQARSRHAGLPRRLRSFLGTLLLLVVVIVYALLVMALSASRIVEAHWAVQALFFLCAGLGWTLPAGVIVRWMARPDPI